MVSAVREANKIQNFIVGEFLKYVIFVVVDLKLISNHRVGLGKCHFFAPGKYPLHTQNMMQSFIVWILKIFSPFTERIQVSFTTKTIESGKENEENIWHSLPSKSFTYQPIKCFLSLAVVCIWGHNTTPGKSEIVCHFWMCKNMLYSWLMTELCSCLSDLWKPHLQYFCHKRFHYKFHTAATAQTS